MKTTRILLIFTTLLLFPWCATQLFSQQNEARKIVINKQTIDEEGHESSETIVKKGAAAEKFDVDKYIRENRSDNTRIEVKVTGGDDERDIVVRGSNTTRVEEEDEETEEEESYANQNYAGYNGYPGAYACTDNSVFLGVDQDSDEDPAKPGLVVNVVRGSAADKAGLRDNDKILKLNETQTNKWSDLSKFVNASKAGDQVRISYERNGKAGNTVATLTKRSDVKCDTKCEAKGFLGVSDWENPDQNDKPGVVVRITDGSSAEKAGLQDGDVIFQLGDTPVKDFEDISDFMAYTKPGEKLNVIYERNGARRNAEAVLTGQQNTWIVDSGNWNLGSTNVEKPLSNGNIGNVTVNVRAKDACLGVFSDAFAEDGAEGSRISDFTEVSAARDVEMQRGDVITAVNGQRIKGHDDLWSEISKYKVGEKVTVEYLRKGRVMTSEIELKACHDNSSRVQILDGDGEQVRNFTSWNWNEEDQERLRERSIITIRRGEGDAPKVNSLPNAQSPAADRSLALKSFRAYPNPTRGHLTLEFNCDPVATTVSFFDLAGRQLFHEELNAFNGSYKQLFDLSEYAKGTIVVRVQQGEKIFTEQVMVD